MNSRQFATNRYMCVALRRAIFLLSRALAAALSERRKTVICCCAAGTVAMLATSALVQRSTSALVRIVRYVNTRKSCLDCKNLNFAIRKQP